MTAYMTRAPLQLINNPHMMSGAPGHGRRTSKRLEEKEDAPLVNGIGHEDEPVKGSKIDAGKQGKGKVNGTSTKPAAKRKPVYDEEDHGFPYTRTQAKKAKAEAALPATVEEEQGLRAETAPPKRARKKSVGSPDTTRAENEARKGTRKSARHSGEHEKESADPQVLPVKKRRKRDSSKVKPGQEGESSAKEPTEKEPSKTTHNHSRQEERQDHTQPIEISFDATKIALPFADTPRIQRNKDMRKTNAARRSSLGLRGRRASSLIDTGRSTAMPHDEVETSEFYKHIESEGLSEPRRMKQLLTWCATRALGEKPSYALEDSNARLAAREIQGQLLKDFSKRSELSDWFNRKESTPPPSLPKPNPKNASNLAKIQDLEQQIARLRTERETWESLLQPPPPPPNPSSSPTSAPPPIDPTLLTHPTQLSALETLETFTSTFHPSLAATTSSRLQRIHQNLEFAIDSFAHNVHALGAYKGAAEGVADRVLGVSAERLEEREGEGRERAGGEVGMRDLLRGLSRVVER